MPSRTDTIRAAFMSLVTSGVALITLLGLGSLTAEQQVGIILFVNNATLLAALLIPAGGTPSTAQGASKI